MKLEKILVCLFAIGVIMKFTNVPMAGLILVVSTLGLSVLYLGFSWLLLSEKGARRQNLAISIVVGILFAQLPLGILFKLQYWPGAGIMLLLSLLYGGILLLVILLNHRHADHARKQYNSRIILRTVIFGVLCAVLYITPTSALVKLQYRNNPEEAAIRANYYEDPENEEYRRALMELEQRRGSAHGL